MKISRCGWIAGLSLVLMASVSVKADETKPEPNKPTETLENQLEALSLPENQSPVAVSKEKFYAVQSRFAPLTKRQEVSLGVGKNLTPSSYLSSNQFDLTYRYHINDKWSLGFNGSYVLNSLTDAGKRLGEMEGLIPDAAYVKYRTSLTATYNLFYGKFRLNMDRVFYFDQYLSLGPGVVILDTGTSLAAVADVGIALWLGKTGSVRIGLKDYFFNEKRHFTESKVNDFVFHLDVGILLGQGGST